MGAGIHLVTGGARSGKSAFAERLVLSMPGPPVYIATAEAGDAEMQARIAAHRARRGDHWQTIEEPRALGQVLRATAGGGPRLVDCLTLWLSNLMLGAEDWRAETEHMIAGLAGQAAPVVFVTNEVGWGIVPENALARAYRDAAGTLNQQVAASADAVYLVVAGQSLQVKPPR